ncbi:TIP-1 family-domain-containing protein [Phycomyces blakesleeanus]|uniref:TIP-1 family-domain-containing protein n=1 Tax=Phycomyces blakesleeanus TaxID=4837 RepID=A0ABR3AI35_PHYBL
MSQSQILNFPFKTEKDTPFQRKRRVARYANSTLENKLRTTEYAKSYIKALLVASELSTKSLNLVKKDPEAAIVPFRQLTKLRAHVKNQIDQEPQDGSYQNLVNQLEKSQHKLWKELNQVLENNFKDSLQSLNWPTPIRPPYGLQLRSKLEGFEKAFHHLLLLQKSLEPEDDKTEPPGEKKVEIPIPIAIMLQDLSLRFRFHFEGSKPTNRLDKPEWYLSHVKTTASSHLPFLVTTVQPIVDSAGLDQTPRISVKDFFIYGLQQDVARKLKKTIPRILNQPSWLSHTVHEVLEFDKSLENEFAYTPPRSSDKRSADVILDNPEWFGAWFAAERQFAQTRYDEIIQDRQAFEAEAEEEGEDIGSNGKSLGSGGGGDPRNIKGTKSSVKILNLIESVTEAYRLVPSLQQRFRFLVEIQLTLLGHYHQRIYSALDSFEALSLIRSVPVPGALPESVTGVMTATETGGTISALKRLYRWWASAYTIGEGIRDWSEDDFFLDMQYQVSQNPKEAQTVMDSLPAHENMFALSLSSNWETPSNSFFAEALNAFDMLSQRIEKLFVKIVAKEWATNAREYAKKDTWWQTSSEQLPGEISSELYVPLQGLRIACQFLYSTLPLSDYLSVYRSICEEIQEWYWRNIITQNQFSKQGSSQLEADMTLGIWKTGKQWVKKPENYTKRLKEATKLLTMTFDGEQDKDALASQAPFNLSYNVFMKYLADPKQQSVLQAELGKLGIEVLSYGQMRDVLRRRNDMLHNWN